MQIEMTFIKKKVPLLGMTDVAEKKKKKRKRRAFFKNLILGKIHKFGLIFEHVTI